MTFISFETFTRRLVDYLLFIRPTRRATSTRTRDRQLYVDIRKQWERLIAIASNILGYPLVNQIADFFTFRHTGATNMAERATNREELMRVINMDGRYER